MDIEELKELRQDLLVAAQDEERFISDANVLEQVMPYMLDSKIIETEEYSRSYIVDSISNHKINSFQINEAGERLQVFIVDEKHLIDDDFDKHICTQRADYESQFNRALRAIKSAIKGSLGQTTQLSDRSGILTSLLQSEEGFNQIDVIEIILVSLSATANSRQGLVVPKSMFFQDDTLKISRESVQKELLIVKTIIDLNFIYEINSSRGAAAPLLIDFDKTFGRKIKVIEAASSNSFSTYLCVLDANMIADLYKRYSSRLLDRNVRSFLQFKGKNKGMRDTIRNQPERFIAYNNGLTITATDVKIESKKDSAQITSLTDFQIVNGGQTTASIYFSKKDGLDVSKVRVMAKINVVKDLSESSVDDLISNISKFSNTQTNVSAVDLRSRSKELVEIKRLSNSVLTPSGRKWFFERSRGEFATKVKMAGAGGVRIKKDYPKDRQFTKDHLAKVFLSWGDEPWLVKKGGEKIFRQFMERIASGDESLHKVSIDRDFYELLVGKIILVNTLTTIYGAGKNSMGQLRSAAVPYSMAILHHYTDGDSSMDNFDFYKIWRAEKVPDDLRDFCENLLRLTNSLLKKYSKSDDVPQYSKNIELWNDIKASQEANMVFEQPSAKKILSKYCG
ncbi:AIPR family protein [Porticoccaceae bacterium]|nr:AIPR family protein [Porticoccaceae bacterium]MDC1477252.1 AIPR family protein [Porticoccaceae bacterium]